MPWRPQGTGKVASRAVPVPGPMVKQGARAALADQGPPWAMVGSPPPKKKVLGRSLPGGVLWKRGL